MTAFWVLVGIPALFWLGCRFPAFGIPMVLMCLLWFLMLPLSIR